ncbi:MAG: hypothetical protein JWM11_6427 [Planctomycetaceae bacterium]|nr:hypothetical protein [Planctomycetaceae bacterium]
MHFTRFIVATICVAFLGGCTTARLRQRTISLGGSLPELQYQQVLSNLALFSTNLDALPWHVNVREGTTQITDSATAGALVDLGPPAVTQPQIFGSRTAVAQWGMSPVIDVTELQLLRVAYRRAFGIQEMPSSELLDDLAHELKEQFASNADLRNESEVFFETESRVNAESRPVDARAATTNDSEFVTLPPDTRRHLSPLAKNVRRKLEMIQRDFDRIQPGWFSSGHRRDVPRTACYVGKCGDRYVWVESDGRQALTEFTLVILKLSTIIKETQTLVSPGTVKFSPGDHGG